MVGALAFGLENKLQKTAEVAGGPTFELEPAEIFGGQIVETPPSITAERHLPCAELFPVGCGVCVHARLWGRPESLGEFFEKKAREVGRNAILSMA